MQRLTSNDLPGALSARPDPASAATPVEAKIGPCPLGWCDGTGWYVEERPAGHPNFGKLMPCGCRLQAAEARARQHAYTQRAQILAQLDSELGGKLARCTFENYFLNWAADDAARASMSTALSACKQYADQRLGWLYIHGPTGVGKSHLAAATAHAIAERTGMATSYTTEPALVSFLREGWGKPGEQSAEGRMRALQTCELLIIDDIGTAFRGKGEQAWVDAQLFELLQPRYLNSRLTILTSNLPPGDLEPRLASRIKGEAEVIRIDNTDQREADHG